MVDSLLRCPIWLWTQASFFPSPSPPQRLQHQLDCCFLTCSHQSCEAVGFIFHIKGYYSFVSLSKSTSTLRVWDFSLLFSSFLPRVKIFYEPRNNGKGNAEQTREGECSHIALQRCPIVYCLSFISFSCFSFCVSLLIILNTMCEKCRT